MEVTLRAIEGRCSLSSKKLVQWSETGTRELVKLKEMKASLMRAYL